MKTASLQSGGKNGSSWINIFNCLCFCSFLFWCYSKENSGSSLKLFSSSSCADEVSWEMYLKGGCNTSTEPQLWAIHAFYISCPFRQESLVFSKLVKTVNRGRPKQRQGWKQKEQMEKYWSDVPVLKTTTTNKHTGQTLSASIRSQLYNLPNAAIF